MPELPEVESLRRSLEPHLLDRVLQRRGDSLSQAPVDDTSERSS